MFQAAFEGAARVMAARPAGVALLTALFWGLWWVPIRWVEALGLPGAWAGVVMVTGGAVMALPLWVLLRLHRGAPLGQLSRHGLLGACGMGAAVMMYSAALVEGEIVRVLLIFYLAPVWAKLLEWAFMGMRWTWVSSLALALSFGGILVLTGGGLEAGLRPGDGLALASGMAWAVGSTLVFTSGDTDTLGLTWVSCTAGAVMAAALALILPGGALTLSAQPVMAGLLMGALYIAPLLFFTSWSARWVAPGILSFLLTAEIASGVLSSVLFSGEPFGWPHALGTALISAGAMAEVLARRGPSATG